MEPKYPDGTPRRMNLLEHETLAPRKVVHIFIYDTPQEHSSHPCITALLFRTLQKAVQDVQDVGMATMLLKLQKWDLTQRSHFLSFHCFTGIPQCNWTKGLL